MSLEDDQFMALALRLSKQGLGLTWPNPSVGAVITSNGPNRPIIGLGVTSEGGRPHAERIALNQAGERAKGATLYVTLEPCSHHGQTPPCTNAIINAGIRKVVYASLDADPRVAGSGIATLEKAGVKVAPASRKMRDQVMRGARAHIKRVRTGYPFVQLKLAVGQDGLMKPGTGSPEWVTGEMARARGHLLRARADAILVGSGTVASDDPTLTCRLPGMENRSPVRVVLDTSLAIKEETKLVQTARQWPLWIFCAPNVEAEKKRRLTEKGVDVATGPESESGIDLPHILSALSERGITRVLVEGGPNILRSFVEQNLADEIYLFQGNEPAGEGGIAPFAERGLELVTKNSMFQHVSDRSLDNDTLTIFRSR